MLTLSKVSTLRSRARVALGGGVWLGKGGNGAPGGDGGGPAGHRGGPLGGVGGPGPGGRVCCALAGGTAGLARTTQRGLVAWLPILGIVGLLMLYSPAERWVFLLALGLALILHLLLDQQRRLPIVFLPHLTRAIGGLHLMTRGARVN